MLAAAKQGCTEAVQHLMSCGANVFARYVKGKTIMHIIAEQGHSAILNHIAKVG